MQKQSRRGRLLQDRRILFRHHDFGGDAVGAEDVEFLVAGAQRAAGELVGAAVGEREHSGDRSAYYAVLDEPFRLPDRDRGLFPAQREQLGAGELFRIGERGLGLLLVFRIRRAESRFRGGELELHAFGVVLQDHRPGLDFRTVLDMTLADHGVELRIGAECRFRLQHEFRRDVVVHADREQRNEEQQQQAEQDVPGTQQPLSLPRPSAAGGETPQRAAVLIRQQPGRGLHMRRHRPVELHDPQIGMGFRAGDAQRRERHHIEPPPFAQHRQKGPPRRFLRREPVDIGR